jgi:hypothetical protein
MALSMVYGCLLDKGKIDKTYDNVSIIDIFKNTIQSNDFLLQCLTVNLIEKFLDSDLIKNKDFNISDIIKILSIALESEFFVVRRSAAALFFDLLDSDLCGKISSDEYFSIIQKLIKSNDCAMQFLGINFIESLMEKKLAVGDLKNGIQEFIASEDNLRGEIKQLFIYVLNKLN